MIRSTGVSIWQFLLPALVIALLVGAFKTALFNPIASVMQSRYEQLESKYLRGYTNLLAVSTTGVWLRQADDYGQSVIHARHVSPQGMEMQDVVILLFEGTDRFASRIDAASARLEDGYWHLRDAWLTGPDLPARHEPEYTVKTDLTFGEDPRQLRLAQIDLVLGPARLHPGVGECRLLGIAPPAVLARAVGRSFRACRHGVVRGRLHAAPQPAARRTMAVIGGGMLTAFMLYFLTDVVFALGLSGTIPVLLAAWGPAGIGVMTSISLLLYLEEG